MRLLAQQLLRKGEMDRTTPTSELQRPNIGVPLGQELLRKIGKIVSQRVWGRRSRTLRVAETLSLGDKRFVAVIEFEGSRFLLGGTSSSLALLTRLDSTSASAICGPSTLDEVSHWTRK